ncbi:MAG TPA: phosphoenolpyruvate--protein phosphotransferase [Ktedonobacterales bacterium]
MNVLRGVPAAPGLAIGTAHLIAPLAPVDLTAHRSVDSVTEIPRLNAAIAAVRTQLEALSARARGTAADILAAHREMLDDPELHEGARVAIDEGATAEAAITHVAGSYAGSLAALPDPYLAARADDVRDIARRIVAALRGVSLDVRLDRPAVLVARDLAPAETVGLDTNFLQAIVTETGSATGHLAIVAQGLGIPCVVGVAGALDAIASGASLIVDGTGGAVTIDPDATALAVAQSAIAAATQAARALEAYRDRPGMTADGTPIEVFANIASLAEAHKAVEQGAEGVGLFRTELLAAGGLPDENAQYQTYLEVAEALRRPLIVRTFDIGGDKPVPGLDIPQEANPFLGWRGIRLALDRPDEIFLPQIRALLRAAATHDIRVMLPMVATPREVAAARALIDTAVRDLESQGIPLRRMPVGIMVETPAAAITLDVFRSLIDFASIGTNDLVQYTYAVDRTNASVRDRAAPLGTATLRLISLAARAGMPLAVCGQLAGDPEAVPLLVGLGVRELSVAPARIPEVKQTLARLTLDEMRALAQQRLSGAD